jgi:hypothetical protein
MDDLKRPLTLKDGRVLTAIDDDVLADNESCAPAAEKCGSSFLGGEVGNYRCHPGSVLILF